MLDFDCVITSLPPCRAHFFFFLNIKVEFYTVEKFSAFFPAYFVKEKKLRKIKFYLCEISSMYLPPVF